MVVAQKAIGDDDMAAGLKRAKAVFKGGGQMIQRIAAHAGVQSVAVRQEGARSHILERIHHNLGIIGTQESQVARLAKVHFDGATSWQMAVNLPSSGMLVIPAASMRWRSF